MKIKINLNNITDDNNVVIVEKDYITKKKFFQEINAEAVLHKKKATTFVLQPKG